MITPRASVSKGPLAVSYSCCCYIIITFYFQFPSDYMGCPRSWLVASSYTEWKTGYMETAAPATPTLMLTIYSDSIDVETCQLENAALYLSSPCSSSGGTKTVSAAAYTVAGAEPESTFSPVLASL